MQGTHIMNVGNQRWSWRPLAVLMFIGGVGCAGAERYDPNTSAGGMASGVGTGGGATASGGAATGPATGTGGGRAAGTGGMTGAPSGGAPGAGGRIISGTGGATGGVAGTVGPAVGPRLTLPWEDDFEADAVSGAAGGWIQDPEDTMGKWAVAMDGATKVLQETVEVSSQSMIVGGDVAWADLNVAARVKFATVTSSSIAYLAVRFVDFDNYYFLEFKGDGSLKIRKRIAAATTDLVSYKTKVALTAGTWYSIGFGFQGNTVTMSLAGAVVGTMAETPSVPRGGIALGFKSASGSFDDVTVTAP